MADRFDILQRKKDHIALCAGDNVGFREKLHQVSQVHNALRSCTRPAVGSPAALPSSCTPPVSATSMSAVQEGPPRSPMVRKLGLLTSLNLAQGLPYGFFTQALPAMLRERGVSLEEIGLASLLALPWGVMAP